MEQGVVATFLQRAKKKKKKSQEFRLTHLKVKENFFFFLRQVSCHSWAANIGLQGALTLYCTQCRTEKPLGTSLSRPQETCGSAL